MDQKDSSSIKSSAPQNFLQLFTPHTPNSIAIEPMTGICNSFNNNIGLNELAPNESYQVEWTMSVATKTDKKPTNHLINKLCNS